MKKLILLSVCFCGLLFLAIACGDDDDYYPSVKYEFVTVISDNEGYIQILIPDDESPLPVVEDVTGSNITPNSSQRVLSRYEVVYSEEDIAMAKIHSLRSIFTPEPKSANDSIFAEGIKTDPVTVVSIWQGGGYLNMVLSLKADTGKGHVFEVVEDVSELEANGVVDWLLYHDANGDAEIYNRSAYVSIPFTQYVDANNPNRAITIRFKYYTYDDDGNAVESDKYYDPGFVYIP